MKSEPDDFPHQRFKVAVAPPSGAEPQSVHIPVNPVVVPVKLQFFLAIDIGLIVRVEDFNEKPALRCVNVNFERVTIKRERLGRDLTPLVASFEAHKSIQRQFCQTDLVALPVFTEAGSPVFVPAGVVNPMFITDGQYLGGLQYPIEVKISSTPARDKGFTLINPASIKVDPVPSGPDIAIYHLVAFRGVHAQRIFRIQAYQVEVNAFVNPTRHPVKLQPGHAIRSELTQGVVDHNPVGYRLPVRGIVHQIIRAVVHNAERSVLLRSPDGAHIGAGHKSVFAFDGVPEDLVVKIRRSPRDRRAVVVVVPVNTVSRISQSRLAHLVQVLSKPALNFSGCPHATVGSIAQLKDWARLIMLPGSSSVTPTPIDGFVQ